MQVTKIHRKGARCAGKGMDGFWELQREGRLEGLKLRFKKKAESSLRKMPESEQAAAQRMDCVLARGETSLSSLGEHRGLRGEVQEVKSVQQRDHIKEVP
ncbi:hypothetical protein HispidOSU_004405, partial [Sigmodon hispidus]